jgi:hypothetical protein
MIKQIKKRFIALILCLIVILNCTVAFGAVNNSDVVENTSPETLNINDDTLFIVEGNEVKVVNSAVYALKRFQEQMKGEASKAGLLSEDDVANWITASRREENAE